jgi:hypothetical protein
MPARLALLEHPDEQKQPLLREPLLRTGQHRRGVLVGLDASVGHQALQGLRLVGAALNKVAR